MEMYGYLEEIEDYAKRLMKHEDKIPASKHDLIRDAWRNLMQCISRDML